MLGIVASSLAQLLLSICAPLISVAKRWGQRWGIYFGIKAIVSTALGDDLAFERVLSVKKITDVVPAIMIELDNRVEEAILSNAISGTDQILVSLYRSISVVPSEFELESLVDSISDIFKAKQIVHSQYYQNDSVIDIAASAICGSLKLILLNRLVAQLFGDSKTARTDAYDAIIAQFSTDPDAVSALLDYAAQNPKNANGVYNTVVTLGGLSRAVTRPRIAEINRFCDQAEKVGQSTRSACDALRSWLEYADLETLASEHREEQRRRAVDEAVAERATGSGRPCEPR